MYKKAYLKIRKVGILSPTCRGAEGKSKGRFKQKMRCSWHNVISEISRVANGVSLHA